jgi:hypothetical protein
MPIALNADVTASASLGLKPDPSSPFLAAAAAPEGTRGAFRVSLSASLSFALGPSRDSLAFLFIKPFFAVKRVE